TSVRPSRWATWSPTSAIREVRRTGGRSCSRLTVGRTPIDTRRSQSGPKRSVANRPRMTASTHVLPSSWSEPVAEQWLSALVRDATHLLFPDGCAGCAAASVPLRFGVCIECVAALDGLRPHRTQPDPVPRGFPACAALGEYAGTLRELLLAYKDRGRHRLARPLGRLLAAVVTQVA